jgi:hypothetical protein
LVGGAGAVTVGLAGLVYSVAGVLPSNAVAAPQGPVAAAATSSGGEPGYWIMASDGGVYHYNTTSFGQLRGYPLNRPIVSGTATPGGLGYWMVASDGGIFQFGDAGFFGSTGAIHLNQPIVGMAPTHDGKGYWLVAADGGIFQFGDAHFYGSTGNIHLNKPIVGMAPTHDGKGYWLVAADGGIFQFGDAHFYGSTGDIHLNQPIVGMSASPTGKGYWLVASDGGIFQFGDAHFYGSTGAVHLNKPIVGMAADGSAGYWLVASDGGLFEFGHAPYLGSTGADPGPAPVVAMAATPVGYPFPPGGIGYDVSLYQCGRSLPANHAFAIVQVSGGAINSPQPNPCYVQEANWAGLNRSAYIFMNSLPSPAPPESLSGPAGTCNGNVGCQSYNFGWHWAVHWVDYSRSVRVDPPLWWLDVEVARSGTDYGMLVGRTASNDSVIAGAIAGLRASGVVAGIYSTSYQWGLITGSTPNYPGIPLWIPGAQAQTGPGYSATNYCASPTYGPRFAGGVAVLVQFGWGTNPSVYPDYACQ